MPVGGGWGGGVYRGHPWRSWHETAFGVLASWPLGCKGLPGQPARVLGGCAGSVSEHLTVMQGFVKDTERQSLGYCGRVFYKHWLLGLCTALGD